MRKILFASSEVHPLVKTGGLADVSASLPMALHEQQQDVRIIMPAYRQCLAALDEVSIIASVKVEGYHLPVDIVESKLPDSDVILWLVHSTHHFDRNGGPYSSPDGNDWEDNAARFALFSRVIAALAIGQIDSIDWRPDILHCNDWQTGLAPALIANEPERPTTIFTIHNLAYQGLYSRDVFDALDLPISLWSSEGIEFYDLMSFMKGGLIFADRITTVSPTYAEEICGHEFGYGLEGLLTQRATEGKLTGILNGIDNHEWDPSSDPYIAKTFSTTTIRKKSLCRDDVLNYFSLPEKEGALVIGLISRLVSQKGIDLALDAVDQLLDEGTNIQLVCLGSGNADFEKELRILRAKYPDRVGVYIGYNEQLAHRIEAGADVFLMPSRFEPCGLNQLYSLRYGTLPIVRNTGGLADSVVNASDKNRKAGTATGFKFQASTTESLLQTMREATALFARPRIWRKMVLTAMEANFSWDKSAKRYLELYDGT